MDMDIPRKKINIWVWISYYDAYACACIYGDVFTCRQHACLHSTY